MTLRPSSSRTRGSIVVVESGFVHPVRARTKVVEPVSPSFPRRREYILTFKVYHWPEYPITDCTKRANNA